LKIESGHEKVDPIDRMSMRETANYLNDQCGREKEQKFQKPNDDDDDDDGEVLSTSFLG
jgi:hypothetical protein